MSARCGEVRWKEGGEYLEVPKSAILHDTGALDDSEMMRKFSGLMSLCSTPFLLSFVCTRTISKSNLGHKKERGRAYVWRKEMALAMSSATLSISR
jgi:hypothetical protein